MGQIRPQLFDIEYFSREIWFVLYRTGHICVFSLPRSNSLERKNYVRLIQAANIRNQISKTAHDRNSHSGPGTGFLWIPKQAKMVPRSYTSSILWAKKVSSWSQAAKRLQMIAENKSSPGTQWATQPPTGDCKVDMIFSCHLEQSTILIWNNPQGSTYATGRSKRVIYFFSLSFLAIRQSLLVLHPPFLLFLLVIGRDSTGFSPVRIDQSPYQKNLYLRKLCVSIGIGIAHMPEGRTQLNSYVPKTMDNDNWPMATAPLQSGDNSNKSSAQQYNDSTIRHF